MRHGRVARRYAGALLQAASDAKVEETVAADLQMVQRTISGSKDLHLLLKSPVIKRESKRTALRTIFEGKVSATTLRFLDLVAEKGREDVLSFIIERFMQLRDVKMGILKMDVTSGAELTTEQQNSLRERFAGLTKKTINMTVSVDKILVGGFLARVGDTVFDGTIKRQLEIMRQRFLDGNGTN